MAVANLRAHLTAAAEDARRGTSGSASIPIATLDDWAARLRAIALPPLPQLAPMNREALAEEIYAAWSVVPDEIARREFRQSSDDWRADWFRAADAVLRLVEQAGAPAAQPPADGPYARALRRVLDAVPWTGRPDDPALAELHDALARARRRLESEDTPTTRPEQEQAEQRAAREELEAMLVPHAEPGESAPDTLRRLLGELRSLRDRLVPWHRGDGETYPALLSRLLAEVEAGRRASGARGVDVGAVREVVKELREQAAHLAGVAADIVDGEDEEKSAAWLFVLADRLDAALGGAGEAEGPPCESCGRGLEAEEREAKLLEDLAASLPARLRHQDLVTLAAGLLVGFGVMLHDDVQRLPSKVPDAIALAVRQVLAAIERAEKAAS